MDTSYVGLRYSWVLTARRNSQYHGELGARYRHGVVDVLLSS
jgi:hypothetical protein